MSYFDYMISKFNIELVILKMNRISKQELYAINPHFHLPQTFRLLKYNLMYHHIIQIYNFFFHKNSF